MTDLPTGEVLPPRRGPAVTGIEQSVELGRIIARRPDQADVLMVAGTVVLLVRCMPCMEGRAP